MPSKYIVRDFTENAHYHIYNLGVEKRKIFSDDKDYQTFLYYLFIYLRPLEEALDKYPDLPMRLAGKNLAEEVELLAYCLMPNHFHLFLKQKTKDAISKLMKQLTNAYTLYFNERYKRVGGLMQGTFKAVKIDDDNDLFIHLVRYIHVNPITGGVAKDLNDYPWSSYADYVGKEKKALPAGRQAVLPCSKEKVLSYFPSVGACKGFHEDQADYGKDLEKLGRVAIDAES